MKGHHVNEYALQEAFVLMFRHKYRYCNKAWCKFVGPHWEELEEDFTDFVIPEFRGDFYQNVVLPVIMWLEKQPQPPCNKAV